MVLKKGKIFYSMGEVAEMFDVNTSLIRFWCDSFQMMTPRRNSRGHRIFTIDDIDDLKVIYRLVKEKGMTLDGAQRQIKDNREGVRRDMEIVDKLMNIRSMMMEIRQELSDDAPTVSSNSSLDLFTIEEVDQSSATNSDMAVKSKNREVQIALFDVITEELNQDVHSEYEAEDESEDEGGTKPFFNEQELF